MSRPRRPHPSVSPTEPVVFRPAATRTGGGTPQAVGDLLAGVLRKQGLSAKLEAASVIPDWEALVGPQIAAVTEPRRVSEGVLIVAVSTSPWMMELNLMKEPLLRRINAGKREGKIRELVFVMGEGGGR